MKIPIYLCVIFFMIACDQMSHVFTCKKWKETDTLLFNVEIAEIDAVDFTITKIKKNKHNVQLISNKSNGYYIITFKFRQAKRKQNSDTQTLLEKLNSDTIEYVDEFQIKYKTNKQGEFEEILNWHELEKYSDSIWQTIKIDTSLALNRERIKRVKNVLWSRSALEARFEREIRLLHLIYGILDSKEVVELNEKTSGLNNQELSSRFKSEQIENKVDNVVMRITQEFDSTNTALQTNNLLRELSSDTVDSKIKITDTALVDFNRKTDWPRQIEYWRMFTIGSMKRQISISIIQIKK